MWLRYLLVIALLVLAYRLLGRLLKRLTGAHRPGGAPLSSGQLVQDPVCRTYVTLDRAISRNVDGQVLHFCSEACAQRFGARKGT